MSEWEITSLDQLVESGAVQLTRGKIISKVDMEAYPGVFPVYSSAKDNDGKFGEYGKYMFDEELITWSVDGGGRLFHRLRHKFSVTNVGGVLRILDRGRIDYRFLFYVLTLRHSEIRFDWVKKAHPSIIRKLYLNIPLPAISEQRRIVAILDEAFEGIATAKAHAEKNLRNAREVFELQRTVIFSENQGSWPRKLLGEVATVQSGGTPLVSTGEFWGGSIAWYSSGELNDLITREPERFITEAGLASSNAKLFPEGSLLVGMYDTAALKMSLLHRPAAFNQAIAGVMPNASLETEFLLHAINVQKLQLLGLRRGVRQKNLSLGKIKEIMIPLPSPRVQREVVERLRDAGARSAQLEDVYRRKLAALDELKQSLLHQAFSGAL